MLNSSACQRSTSCVHASSAGPSPALARGGGVDQVKAAHAAAYLNALSRKTGARLYRALGTLDGFFGASSFAEALRFFAIFEQKNQFFSQRSVVVRFDQTTGFIFDYRFVRAADPRGNDRKTRRHIFEN